MADDDQNLDLLERDIQTWKLEYTRFLNGAADTPPEELFESIRSDIRQLHEQTRSTAARFRLQGLEARYSSYSELFDRRMQVNEIGGRNARDVSSDRNLDECRFIIGEVLDPSAAESLYEGLYGGSGKGTSVDFQTFVSYVESQCKRIQKKTGCAEVQFRIANENGKRRLKARPADPRFGPTPTSNSSGGAA